MRELRDLHDFLTNWYPNCMTYQDTDCLNENNMTDEAVEYYKDVLNKKFGIVKKEETKQ